MNQILQSPEAIHWTLVLLRISLILGTAWVFHFLLRKRNPRWQIRLWRSTVLVIFVVSLASPWLTGWGYQIGKPNRSNLLPNVFDAQTDSATASIPGDASSRRSATETSKAALQSQTRPMASSANMTPVVKQSASLSAVFLRVLCGGYLLVVACHLFSFIVEALRLSQLLNRCGPADDRWTQMVGRIARLNGMKCIPDVVVSEEISGPMATGLLRPRIVIPAGLPDQLTERHQEFVIGHECSHLRDHDLWWSMLIGIVRIGLWPHPLVWKLQAAHRLACDLRCDAAAAGQHPADYGTMLAQMALRICAKPQPHLSLAFLTKSEVLQRVRRVQSGSKDDRLTRPHRWMAAMMILTLCIVGTAGINGCSEGDGFFSAVDREAIQEVQVTVTDVDGNPIKDAIVVVDGLRTVKEALSAHGNRLAIKGMTKATTNEQGIATLSYPKYVVEEMETGTLIITVTHPDFVMNYGDHAVDSSIEIQLNPGRRLTVSAIDSATGKPITEGLYGLLPGRIGPEVWNRKEDGTLYSNALPLETRTLLLVRYQEGQTTLFSDLIDFNDYPIESSDIANVPMSPGERVAGQLSENVTRPVGDSRVGLSVSMTFDVNPSYDTSVSWGDYTTIKPDGTFEFDSVPRGAEIQLTAVNNDWVSVSASPDEILARFPYITTGQHAQNMHDTMVVGQSFAPGDPRPLVLEMEPTATCEFTVVDDAGESVEGAAIYMSPNMVMAAHGGIIGMYGRTVEVLGKTTEEQWTAYVEKRTAALTSDGPEDKFGRYMATTDKTGKATMRALPGKRGQTVNLEHEQFELGTMKNAPFHRGLHVDLIPGQTTEVKLTVQPKGVEVLGR